MQHQVMTSSRDISFQKVNRPILIVGGFILYIRIPTNVTCFAVGSLIISNIWCVNFLTSLALYK